jgi:hypothetical protein
MCALRDEQLRAIQEAATRGPIGFHVLGGQTGSDGGPTGFLVGLPLVNFDKSTGFTPEDARALVAAFNALPELLEANGHWRERALLAEKRNRDALSDLITLRVRVERLEFAIFEPPVLGPPLDTP